MANILVVDDEMGIRELLSEILGDEGHAVQLAENAQQAGQARQQGAPDLVLLDIWMPDTDGVTLLKERQRDGLLSMPVIMMSGHATIDTAVDAFERMYFEHHLGREGGSMTRVAEKTGLERTHLYRKLKQLGVEPGKLGKKSVQ